LRKRRTASKPSLSSLDRAGTSRMAALLGENEFVLRCQPQAIGVAAMNNDNVARADEQIPARHAIVDDGQTSLDT
jgi:hypothetical protein